MSGQLGRSQKLASADPVTEGLGALSWASIRQQYRQRRHAAFPVDGGYQARNPDHAGVPGVIMISAGFVTRAGEF
jgi:hypothetical protein